MCTSLLVAAALLAASPDAGVRPSPRDKCPVCGMFVAKHPDWLAGIAFRDGSRALFDGAKDMLKFWLEPSRFAPARKRDDLASAFVTDYYGVAQIDARSAFFVVGSDVLGPMGRELVALATRADADEFVRDHHGGRILRLDDVTPDLLRSLDE